jgi:predicted transcriptional regulator
MRVLTIDVCSDAQWESRTAPFFTDTDPHRTYISYSRANRVLRLMSMSRFQIVQFLIRRGAHCAATIAAGLGRNRLMVERDLQILLESEVIDRDREHRYYFAFDAIRVVLQFPLPGDDDPSCNRRTRRSRRTQYRTKSSRRVR